jgi:hypothetical protein
MAVRPKYNKTKGSLVSMGASEQGLDYKLKGYSSYVDSLNTKLASMQKYSQKKAEDEATDKGINEALETNRDTDAFLAADDKTKKEMVGEDKWFKSKKEVAYTKTMYALYTNDIFTKAQTDIHNLDIQATLQGMTSKDYYKNLITIKNNYSSAFADIDGEAALGLNKEFMSTIPKLYSAYAAKESEKYVKVRQANVIALGRRMSNKVGQLVRGHLDKFDPKTLFASLENIKLEVAAKIGVEAIDTTAFQTAFHKEFLAALADEFSVGSENNAFKGLKNLKQFKNGKFVDPKLQAVYKQLSATDKDAIEKALKSSLKGEIDIIKNKEKIDEALALAEAEEFEEEFNIYLATGNRESAMDLIETLKSQNKFAAAASFQETLGIEKNKKILLEGDYGEFVSGLELDIQNGKYTSQTLREDVFNKNLLDFEDWKRLNDKVVKFADKRFKRGINKINLTFSYSEGVGYTIRQDKLTKQKRDKLLIEYEDEIDRLKREGILETPESVARRLLKDYESVKDEAKEISESLKEVNNVSNNLFKTTTDTLVNMLDAGVFPELNKRKLEKNKTETLKKIREQLEDINVINEIINYVSAKRSDIIADKFFLDDESLNVFIETLKDHKLVLERNK